MGNSPMSAFEEEKYQIQSSNNRKSASVFQVDDQQFLEKKKKHIKNQTWLSNYGHPM